jgi:hypothetical protein
MYSRKQSLRRANDHALLLDGSSNRPGNTGDGRSGRGSGTEIGTPRAVTKNDVPLAKRVAPGSGGGGAPQPVLPTPMEPPARVQNPANVNIAALINNMYEAESRSPPTATPRKPAGPAASVPGTRLSMII